MSGDNIEPKVNNCDISSPLLRNNDGNQEARLFQYPQNERTSLNNSIPKINCDILPSLLLSYGKDTVENPQKSQNHRHFPNCDSLPDPRALSMLSLNQNQDLENEMSTNRDFSEASDTKMKVHIENISNNIEDVNGIARCDCNNSSQLNNNEKLLNCPQPTIYFNDKVRSVDFVLVWDSFKEDATVESAYQKRTNFEENLMKEGLQLEYEEPQNNGLNFIKIHTPKEVLRRYGEILKLRMPMKENIHSSPKSSVYELKDFAVPLSGHYFIKEILNRALFFFTRKNIDDSRLIPVVGNNFGEIWREDGAADDCFTVVKDNLKYLSKEIAYGLDTHNGLHVLHMELCKLPKEYRHNRLFNTAEYLRQKVPGLQRIHRRTNFIMDGLNTQWEKIKSYVLVDKKTFPEKGQRFTAVYSRDREYLFDVDSPCFFTPAIHSRVVQFILDRKRFTEKEDDNFAFGIERLLNDNIYTAAYPLHDGDLKQSHSMRNLLYREWTSLRKWYKYQPLDHVNEYFGVKIALYFAWLGFYTHMLLPASLVGLACFIYSCLTLYDNQLSEDICKSDEIIMCPLCDNWCDYWDLKETCVHSRITYLFDNATTVFFAIFMSFWATLFLELWKRYSAEITHRWDLTGFDIKEEHPRPEYLARLAHVTRKEVNVITNAEEPRVPFWKMRVPATILSFSAVLLLVTLGVATVLGVVFYRMSVLASLRFDGDRVTSYAILFTTSTAACINLCCIVVLNWVYGFVAQYLTELELHRTQTEFDDSLTLKIYLLQFVNYYASIFYIAFFKGKFIGSPKHYNTIFGYRQEECGPGGCLLELCIQLSIIMVGKQAMNTVLEMLFPLFYKWLNTLKVKTGIQKDQCSQKGPRPQWVKDFKLVEWGPRSLFPEYLEMVLQYGFLTIFVAAFPLAPFFALLNNMLEMRLDARKLVTFYRRPVTQRVRDIGVWYRILDSIGKLSVVTNGFIIAFTSNFIPRLVYILTVSEEHTLYGYLNFSLSYFNTSDFIPESYPKHSKRNYTVCRYPDYREPPWNSNNYYTTLTFWNILAARLAFVVVFENVVAFVIIMVKWLIPDIPGALSDKIRREAFITNEIIIKQEAMRARSARPSQREDNISTAVTIAELGMPATPEQWDRVIAKSLSGSDWELLVHNNIVPDSPRSRSSPKCPTSV